MHAHLVLRHAKYPLGNCMEPCKAPVRQVWSCGLGLYGELGLGRQTTARHPVRITDFDVGNDPLVAISCGADNCGAVSQNGRVYVWGAKYLPNDRSPT